jgi:hypothetical protein
MSYTSILIQSGTLWSKKAAIPPKRFICFILPGLAAPSLKIEFRAAWHGG